MLPEVASPTLPPPPLALLKDASLFIDFDGTLVDLIDHPDAIVVDAGLRDLLGALGAAYPGRLALVSGRSIAQLDLFLGELLADFAVAGSHGGERRSGGALASPNRPPELDGAITALRRFASTHPGTLVEPKSFGVTLHYRLAPETELAAHRLGRKVADAHGLTLQHGKMMVELKAPGGDKGDAVRAFMAEPPMAGTRPIVLGDDLTDEAGFAAAKRLGGAGILVGPIRPTAARYHLPDVAATRAWLADAIGARR